MAKATATCTCRTCGKTFEVFAVKQNRREADSWEEWAQSHYDECTDCFKARKERERQEENANSAFAADNAGLPALSGSEKQVAWATTIRQKFYDEWAQFAEKNEKAFPDGHMVEASEIFPNGSGLVDSNVVSRQALEWLVSNRCAASWWIDHRDLSFYRLFELILNAVKSGEIVLSSQGESQEEAQVREEAQAESVAAPENQTHTGVVDVTVTEISVSASYVKDDDFRELVKGLGYRWDSDSRRWSLKLGLTTGSGPDRAAELGNLLLNAGFAVRIADPDTLRAAISGDYSPMTYRWVTRLVDQGFYITWGRDDDFYSKVKAIPGARYKKPGVLVPFSQWQQVQDFASIYDFKLSPGAQSAIQNASASVSVVSPAPVKVPEYHEQDLGKILDSDSEVIDDLYDN